MERRGNVGASPCDEIVSCKSLAGCSRHSGDGQRAVHALNDRGSVVRCTVPQVDRREPLRSAAARLAADAHQVAPVCTARLQAASC